MSGQQDQGSDKSGAHILWVIGLVFVIGLAIWYGFENQLKYFFILVRRAELFVLELLFRYMPFETELASSLAISKQITVGNLSGTLALRLSEIVGKYLRYPVGLMFLWMLVYTFRFSTKMRYRKKYDLKRILAQEQEMWPVVKPVVDLDLVAEDLDKGPWAMGMTPIQFSRRFKILQVAKNPKTSVLSTAPDYVATIDQGRAERVFVAQLGTLWRGPEKLSPIKKAVYAALIAKAARDPKSSRALVEQLAISGAKKKVNLSNVDALIKKYNHLPKIKAVQENHAYELTVIFQMMIVAREDGVLASSDFLWVKPLDRRLWFTLNAVGRQTSPSEAAGVFSHWLAERAIRRSLTMPMVSEAVKALALAVGDIIYVPTDEEKAAIEKQAEGMHA